jgi:hypothetical protein
MPMTYASTQGFFDLDSNPGQADYDSNQIKIMIVAY